MINIKTSIIITLTILILGCSKTSQNKTLKPVNEYNKEKIEKIEEFNLINKKSYKKKKKSIKKLEKVPNFISSPQKEYLYKRTYKKKNKISFSKNKPIKINVEKIPLNEFIDFVFSSIFNFNYSVSQSVQKIKKPVTLNMTQETSKGKVFEIVKEILQRESVSIDKKNNTFFIDKQKRRKTKKKSITNKHIIFGKSIPSKLYDEEEVTLFISYEFITPKEIYNAFRKLKIPNVKYGNITKYMHILEGKVKDIKEALKIIEILDTPSFENKKIYLLKLENIDVETFHKRITTILKANGTPIASNIQDVGIVLERIPELNSILVISPKKRWFKMVKYWQNKLDVLSEEVDTPHFYFYSIKNRKADDLASMLQGVVPDISIKQDSNSTKSSTNTQYNKNQEFIKPDLYTNSLLIFMKSDKYKKLLPIIKKLDQMPLEVLVEVTLAEVDISEGYNTGFEWSILNDKAGGTNSGAYTVNFGTNGISSTLFQKNITSVVNSFAEKKLLDILSRPRLMILNNETGNINIGQQVPVVSSEVTASDIQTSTNNSNILRNIKYIDTGITLSLTPTINSNGTLMLKTNISLSEAGVNNTSSIDSPLITNTSLDTTIVMPNDTSVLIGGLISRNNSKANSGVPFLKDIPILGEVFKGSSNTIKKTELIILLHPKIITHKRELLKERKKFKILLTHIKHLNK